jgi:predicted transcriptional regulator
VGELEGIVPLPRGKVRVVPLPTARLDDPGLARQLREVLGGPGPTLLLAFGLEAFHVLSQARPSRPFVRFGVAAAIEEATRLGVDCTLVVADRDLPRLFEQFVGPDVPELEFLPLGGRGRAGRTARRG